MKHAMVDLKSGHRRTGWRTHCGKTVPLNEFPADRALIDCPKCIESVKAQDVERVLLSDRVCPNCHGTGTPIGGVFACGLCGGMGRIQ